jgi:hypothetical protein
MTRLYRCYACVNPSGVPGLDFEGELPVCPNCKLDGSKVRFASYIAIREVIHFDAPFDHPTLRDTMGVGHAACTEKIVIAANSAVRATGVPRAVTCPRCQETDAFRKANEDVRGVVPERDVPVVATTPQGGIEFAKSEAIATDETGS